MNSYCIYFTYLFFTYITIFKTVRNALIVTSKKVTEFAKKVFLSFTRISELTKTKLIFLKDKSVLIEFFVL